MYGVDEYSCLHVSIHVYYMCQMYFYVVYTYIKIKNYGQEYIQYLLKKF